MIPPAPIAPRSPAEFTNTNRGFAVWAGLLSPPDIGVANDGAHYDFTRRRWFPVPPPPLTPRIGAVFEGIGDELLVWGGGGDPFGAGLEDAYSDGARYDPEEGVWRRLAQAPLEPRTSATAIWDPIQARLVIFGGTRDGKSLIDGAAYAIEDDGWDVLDSCPLDAPEAVFTLGLTGSLLVLDLGFPLPRADFVLAGVESPGGPISPTPDEGYGARGALYHLGRAAWEVVEVPPLVERAALLVALGDTSVLALNGDGSAVVWAVPDATATLHASLPLESGEIIDALCSTSSGAIVLTAIQGAAEPTRLRGWRTQRGIWSRLADPPLTPRQGVSLLHNQRGVIAWGGHDSRLGRDHRALVDGALLELDGLGS